MKKIKYPSRKEIQNEASIIVERAGLQREQTDEYGFREIPRATANIVTVPMIALKWCVVVALLVLVCLPFLNDNWNPLNRIVARGGEAQNSKADGKDDGINNIVIQKNSVSAIVKIGDGVYVVEEGADVSKTQVEKEAGKENTLYQVKFDYEIPKIYVNDSESLEAKDYFNKKIRTISAKLYADFNDKQAHWTSLYEENGSFNSDWTQANEEKNVGYAYYGIQVTQSSLNSKLLNVNEQFREELYQDKIELDKGETEKEDSRRFIKKSYSVFNIETGNELTWNDLFENVPVAKGIIASKVYEEVAGKVSKEVILEKFMEENNFSISEHGIVMNITYLNADFGEICVDWKYFGEDILQRIKEL